MLKVSFAIFNRILGTLSTFGLLFYVVFLAPSNLYAQPSTEIKANVEQGHLVHLSIQYFSKNKNGKARILIARSENHSRKFQTIARVKVSNLQTTEIFDQLNPDLSLANYRSRLISKRHSKWSKIISVNLDQETQNQQIQNPAITKTPAPTVVSNTTSLTLPQGLSACPRESVIDMFTLINAVRTNSGLQALTEQSHLALSSQNFSAHLAYTSKLSHEGWYDNMLSFGFAGHSAGQNIGHIYSPSASSILDLFLASPGHRLNILSSKFIYLGVGCVLDQQGSLWWTQDFGGQ